MPGAKIEVSSICDDERGASSASPISLLVYRRRYPRAISSLVIPTWLIERQIKVGRRRGNTMKVRCQSPYKVQRRKGLEGGAMTRNDLVDCFMCGLIVGVEDLVHFM
jgi:hypothetical protein